GAGLDPATAEAAFGRGWSTKSAGRGLGLALVQQAVRRNSGTVEVSRTPDGGAEFTVRMPLTEAALAEPGTPLTKAIPKQPTRQEPAPQEPAAQEPAQEPPAQEGEPAR
ncbi:ATP-binding protein, partial [Streptomyces sp. 2MCAF27]